MESAVFALRLRPFLHENTDLFLHEFISFAKSPLDMIAYDARVSYGLQEQQQQSSSAMASSSAGSQGKEQVLDELFGKWLAPKFLEPGLCTFVVLVYYTHAHLRLIKVFITYKLKIIRK